MASHIILDIDDENHFYFYATLCISLMQADTDLFTILTRNKAQIRRDVIYLTVGCHAENIKVSENGAALYKTVWNVTESDQGLSSNLQQPMVSSTHAVNI